MAGATRGAVSGTAVGILAGLFVATFPAAGLVAKGAALTAGAIGGAGFGLWVGSMIGSSVPNSQIKEWQELIDLGYILIVVEVSIEIEQAVVDVLNQSNLNVVAFASQKDGIPIL